MKSKVSKAGQAAQAEWAGYAARPDMQEYLLDRDHDDARRIQYAAAEKVRIAAKKAAQVEAKARKIAAINATCQICGRPIQDSTGVIAHHGYTRPGNGWQTASCLGARFPRYEDSRDRIPYVIDLVEGYVAATEAELKKVTATPPESISYASKERIKGADGKPVAESYYAHAWRAIQVPVARPEGFGPDSVDAYASPSYRSLYNGLLNNLRNEITSSRETIAYLKARQ